MAVLKLTLVDLPRKDLLVSLSNYAYLYVQFPVQILLQVCICSVVLLFNEYGSHCPIFESTSYTSLYRENPRQRF